jgi:hypothetical protein
VSVATASRAVLRAGVVACLLLATLAFAVHASEYPLTTRAGLRVHATDVLPLLALGVLNLVALEAAPSSRLRATLMGLAIVGNVLLTADAVRLLGPGAPLFPSLQAGAGALLVVGSVGCALTRASAAVR